MTKLQLALQRACQALGLNIDVPYTLVLRQGVQIHAQALLSQLGAPKGMIIVGHYDDLRGMAKSVLTKLN